MPTAAAKADQESLTARRDSADRLLAIGREMVRRGRVQPQDFALLQKLAVHETLLPSINGDDWAEGSRKGWIDRLMEENHLSAAERDRAEAVGRRVAAIGLAEMVESGDMPPAEGRAILADVVQLPGRPGRRRGHQRDRQGRHRPDGDLAAPNPRAWIGRDEQPVTADDEREFRERHANSGHLARERPEHPLPVADKAVEGVPDEGGED